MINLIFFWIFLPSFEFQKIHSVNPTHQFIVSKYSMRLTYGNFLFFFAGYPPLCLAYHRSWQLKYEAIAALLLNTALYAFAHGCIEILFKLRRFILLLIRNLIKFAWSTACCRLRPQLPSFWKGVVCWSTLMKSQSGRHN